MLRCYGQWGRASALEGGDAGLSSPAGHGQNIAKSTGRGGQREEQAHDPETDMYTASSQTGHPHVKAVASGVREGGMRHEVLS